MVVGLALAVALHVGLGWWGASLDIQREPPKLPDRMVAKAVYQDVELPKPPPPPPPPPPEPKPEPKPEPVVKKEAPKPKPKPKKRGQPKRKKKKRKKQDNKPKPKPNEPAPLVLSKTYGSSGDGGVTVQQGDEDMFGDPAVEANERNTRPRDDDGDDKQPAAPGPTGDGGKKERKVVIVHARPKSRCKVDWPEGAAASRRIVEVTLLLSIDKRGRVSPKKILRSAGEPFDSAAKKALRACAFKPGTRDGKAFTDRVPFVVEFRPGSGA